MSMMDSLPETPAMDGGLPPPNWHAAAPTLGMRSIAAVVLVVPLLLVAGVYWLHQLPSPNGRESNDDVIEVRLIGPQGAVPQRQDSPQPQVEEKPPADPLIDDPNHAMPAEAASAASAEPQGPAGLPEPRDLRDRAMSRPAGASGVRKTPSLLASDAEGAYLARQESFESILTNYITRFTSKEFDRYASVKLTFTMRRDGAVTGVWVISSSGDSHIDQMAIDAIRRAQPMPRIPAGLPDELRVPITVTFREPDSCNRDVESCKRRRS